MKLCGLLLVTLLVLIAGLGVEARAQLVAPPWRDTAGATYADWAFSTSAAIAAPEIFTNAYGVPVATITLGWGASGYWSEFPPVTDGGVGVWDVGEGTNSDYPGLVGSVMLVLPVGSGTGAGTTKVWIQAVYYLDFSGPPTVAVPGATLTASTDTLLAVIPGWGQWRVSLTEWQIASAQADVQAVLYGNNYGTLFDRIVVDTQVVPPAGTLTITATTNQNWVYQNTPDSTFDRHVLMLTVKVTQDTFGNHSYTTTVSQSSPGLVTPTGFWTAGTLFTPSPSGAWSGLTGYLVGGRRSDGITGTGSCTLTVAVIGDVAGVGQATVTVTVRRLGDVDGSGEMDCNDLASLNARLNALDLAPQKTAAGDLTGDGYVTTADRVLLNRILNRLPVP